eukprot:NODE_287_length_1017_cov_115.977528_g280_i0.p1 GENE.NODE_287_length_1017_cov_115.977528_g280_i0~~NODE_287_length_1017_cov_115.977528_g280_i0.p1  ORF type:complete len:277 (-),score=37.43 NODE_287_length_1017_cov_115.977528_g280_i0:187-960(-)
MQVIRIARCIAVLSFLQLCMGLAHCFFTRQGPVWVSNAMFGILCTLSAAFTYGNILFPGHLLWVVPLTLIVALPTYVTPLIIAPNLGLIAIIIPGTVMIGIVFIASLLVLIFCRRPRESAPVLSLRVTRLLFGLALFSAVVGAASVIFTFSLCQSCPDCHENNVSIGEGGGCSGTEQACTCYNPCGIDGCHFGCDRLTPCYYLHESYAWLITSIAAVLAAANSVALAGYLHSSITSMNDHTPFLKQDVVLGKDGLYY